MEMDNARYALNINEKNEVEFHLAASDVRTSWIEMQDSECVVKAGAGNNISISGSTKHVTLCFNWKNLEKIGGVCLLFYLAFATEEKPSLSPAPASCPAI